MASQAEPVVARSKDLKRQIANFEQLVGNILSTGERAGVRNPAVMLDQLRALHAAIEADDVDAISQLAEEGVDVNAKFDDSVNPQHAGITPLALACATNKPESVKALIENGADVNQPFAALNTTALMTSSYHGHVEVVRLLLACGADVHMVDLQQSTALGYGFGGSRNLEVVQLLLDHHIDVNRKNMLGMNALLLVAGYGNEALVEKILRAGANPNTVNDFGHSALHLTVVGKRDLLKKLRRLGSAEAVAADRSLNRRNLDVAIQEWARVHRDEVGGTQEDEEALAKAGSIMMSVGHQLDDHPNEDDDEQAILQRRVQAVWKHRQEKIQKNKERNKSGIWNLLSCGGGKSSRVDETNKPGARPYTASAAAAAAAESPAKGGGNQQQDEIGRLSHSFARILRLLIDAGCEIDRAERTFGMTALDLAILNGDVESSAVLTSGGADPNHFLKMLSLKELYQAIVTGQRKDVKDQIAFDEDLDVNQVFSRFNVDSQSADEGMTPLTLAVRQDDIEVVRMLLKKGANVNMMGPAGRYPLAEASAKGNMKMAALLLQNGADLEKTCPAMQEATPVTIAANMQHHKLVEFYLKRGAKVDKPMSDGRIALLRAFESRDMEMVDVLLRLSGQDNFTDMQGLTAHLAAEYQSKDRDTEAILSKVSDAVHAFQEEEEAIAAAAAAANTSNDMNQPSSFSDQQESQEMAAPPLEQLPPGGGRRIHPGQAMPQQAAVVQQLQQQQQQMPYQQEPESPPRAAVEATMPQQQAQQQQQRPPVQQRHARPTQPAPEVPPSRQEAVDESMIVASTAVAKQASIPDEVFVRGPPPPVPATSPPALNESQVPAAAAAVAMAAAGAPAETSSPQGARKGQEEEMEETSSSEYETDDDEDDDEEDESEEDEEEEEEEEEEQQTVRTQTITEEVQPGVKMVRTTTTTVKTVPVSYAQEVVVVEGETDIDAATPTPHESSDVNENVVKTLEEDDDGTTTTTTTRRVVTTRTIVKTMEQEAPPPVPVTSPPRESTETTV